MSSRANASDSPTRYIGQALEISLKKILCRCELDHFITERLFLSSIKGANLQRKVSKFAL